MRILIETIQWPWLAKRKLMVSMHRKKVKRIHRSIPELGLTQKYYTTSGGFRARHLDFRVTFRSLPSRSLRTGRRLATCSGNPLRSPLSTSTKDHREIDARKLINGVSLTEIDTGIGKCHNESQTRTSARVGQRSGRKQEVCFVRESWIMFQWLCSAWLGE